MIVGRRHIMKRWIIDNHWHRVALSYKRAHKPVHIEYFDFLEIDDES